MSSEQDNESLKLEMVDLQSRLAFQDESLRQLGDEVYKQEAEIRELKAGLKSMMESFRSFREEIKSGSDVGGEVPPHY